MSTARKYKTGFAVRYIRARLRLLARVSPKRAAALAFKIFTSTHSRVRKTPSPVFSKADALQFNFSGVTVRGYRWNHPAQKKVLILHGYESSILYFDHFVTPLVKKGYEVIGFDAPAHGRSGGKQIHAVDYKNFIKEIVKRYGPITSFITHSFGGLALGLALEDLPHDASWKAVFIAPATESTRAIENFFWYMRLGGEVRREFDALLTAVNNLPADWYSVRRASANISAQVLMLQDRQDEITPLSDVQPIIDKDYPNFRFVLSDGLGHRNIYRDKGSLQTIVDFL